MLLRDKGLQSSLQKIVTFMFQALVLVHNIVTSVWHIYLCCTALCCLLLCFYSIVTHSKAGNCHFDVSGFYREAKYLHFLPVFDTLLVRPESQSDKMPQTICMYLKVVQDLPHRSGPTASLAVLPIRSTDLHKKGHRTFLFRLRDFNHFIFACVSRAA